MIDDLGGAQVRAWWLCKTVKGKAVCLTMATNALNVARICSSIGSEMPLRLFHIGALSCAKVQNILMLLSSDEILSHDFANAYTCLPLYISIFADSGLRRHR